MKRRILALSRDRGSMQAIAPVILGLNKSGRFDVTLLATRESWPVISELGLPASLLDEAAFAADPSACVRALLDTFRPDLVLMGSSPARGAAPETPEQFLIIEARRRGLASLAVQDYWGMYVERFSRDGRALAADLLPDRLCVLDRRALADLEAFGVPRDRMVVTHNPWLDSLVAQAGTEPAACRRSPAGAITVLLASQPLDSMQHLRHWPYDQYTLFEHLLAAMPVPAEGGPSTVRVLPHPLEDVSRWESLLARAERNDIKLELRRDRTPDLLLDADYLVTSHSTVAYEALYFGTPCISLRPTDEPVPPLWIEEAGLSHGFKDAQALRDFLGSSDPLADRRRVVQLKRDLSAEGLFFSDGLATGRVTSEVHQLIGSRGKALLQ